MIEGRNINVWFRTPYCRLSHYFASRRHYNYNLQKFKQPVILGYIIAGFITGHNFNFFPTVNSSSEINIWSEIGVIFLLFTLGLEFSFYKLKRVGGQAFIATFIIMSGPWLLAILVACFWAGML